MFMQLIIKNKCIFTCHFLQNIQYKQQVYLMKNINFYNKNEICIYSRLHKFYTYIGDNMKQQEIK